METSVKQGRSPCFGPPRDSTNYCKTEMLVHTGGGQNNDFGPSAQTDLIIGLVLSVAQAGTTHNMSPLRQKQVKEELKAWCSCGPKMWT